MLFSDINLIWVMSIVCQSRWSRRHFAFKLLTLLMSFVGNRTLALFLSNGYLCNKYSKKEYSGILLSSGYKKQLRFLAGSSLPRQSEGSLEGDWDLLSNSSVKKDRGKVESSWHDNSGNTFWGKGGLFWLLQLHKQCMSSPHKFYALPYHYFLSLGAFFNKYLTVCH